MLNLLAKMKPMLFLDDSHESTLPVQEMYLVIQLEIYENQFKSAKMHAFRNILELMHKYYHEHKNEQKLKVQQITISRKGES